MPGPRAPEQASFHVVPMALSKMSKASLSGKPFNFHPNVQTWSQQTEVDIDRLPRRMEQFAIYHNDKRIQSDQPYPVTGPDGSPRFPFAYYLSNILTQDAFSLKADFAGGLGGIQEVQFDDRGHQLLTPCLGASVDARTFLHPKQQAENGMPFIYFIDGDESPYRVTRIFWDPQLACFYVRLDEVTLEMKDQTASPTIKPITRFAMGRDSEMIEKLQLWSDPVQTESDRIEAIRLIQFDGLRVFVEQAETINAFFKHEERHGIPTIPEELSISVSSPLAKEVFCETGKAMLRDFFDKAPVRFEAELREKLATFYWEAFQKRTDPLVNYQYRLNRELMQLLFDNGFSSYEAIVKLDEQKFIDDAVAVLGVHWANQSWDLLVNRLRGMFSTRAWRELLPSEVVKQVGLEPAEGNSVADMVFGLYLEGVSKAGKSYQDAVKKSQKEREPKELDTMADDWYQLWCAANGKDPKQLDSVVSFLDEAKVTVERQIEAKKRKPAKTETVEYHLWGHFWSLLAKHVPDDQVGKLIHETNRMLSQDAYESFMIESAPIVFMWPILVLSLLVYGVLRAAGIFKSYGDEYRGIQGKARDESLIDENGFIQTDRLFNVYQAYKEKEGYLGTPREGVHAVVDAPAPAPAPAPGFKEEDLREVLHGEIEGRFGKDVADGLAREGIKSDMILSVIQVLLGPSRDGVDYQLNSIAAELRPFVRKYHEKLQAAFENMIRRFDKPVDAGAASQSLDSDEAFHSVSPSPAAGDAQDGGSGSDNDSDDSGLAHHALHGNTMFVTTDQTTASSVSTRHLVEAFMVEVSRLDDLPESDRDRLHWSCAMAWVAVSQEERRHRPNPPAVAMPT